MNSLCLWPLVDVKVLERNGDHAEELVDADEAAVQHGQHDLGLVALVGDGTRERKKSLETSYDD